MEDTAWKMEAREVWPWAAGPMTDGVPALTKNEIFLLIQCTDHITCHTYRPYKSTACLVLVSSQPNIHPKREKEGPFPGDLVHVWGTGTEVMSHNFLIYHKFVTHDLAGYVLYHFV